MHEKVMLLWKMCCHLLLFRVEHYKLTLLYAQRCRELIFFTRYFVKRTMCKLLIPESQDTLHNINGDTGVHPIPGYVSVYGGQLQKSY